MQSWITLFLMCWIYARAGAEETVGEIKVNIAEEAVTYLDEAIKSLQDAVEDVTKAGGPQSILQNAEGEVHPAVKMVLEKTQSDMVPKNDTVSPRFWPAFAAFVVVANVMDVAVDIHIDILDIDIHFSFGKGRRRRGHKRG